MAGATIRRVVGRSTDTPGCVAHLAFAAMDEARLFDFEVVSTKLSRSQRYSPSRYITVRDPRGRKWMVRVSNHYRPQNARSAPPHFDLVSLDGRSGLAEIRRFLALAASGEIDWWDRDRLTRHPALKRRGKRSGRSWTA